MTIIAVMLACHLSQVERRITHLENRLEEFFKLRESREKNSNNEQSCAVKSPESDNNNSENTDKSEGNV